MTKHMQICVQVKFRNDFEPASSYHKQFSPQSLSVNHICIHWLSQLYMSCCCFQKSGASLSLNHTRLTHLYQRETLTYWFLHLIIVACTPVSRIILQSHCSHFVSLLIALKYSFETSKYMNMSHEFNLISQMIFRVI